MTKQQYDRIRAIARVNLENMRKEAAVTLERAQREPLLLGTVHRAIAAQARLEGYEAAVTSLLDGMVGSAMEAGE